jgi:hypothetical protein
MSDRGIYEEAEENNAEDTAVSTKSALFAGNRSSVCIAISSLYSVHRRGQQVRLLP